MNPAVLALEDGTVFEGRSFGAPAERSGEVVFNTAITGYQEIFTDPSYSGQIVILTNPQIGNYGTNADDNEAAQALYRRPGGPRIFAASQATGARTRTAQQFLTTNRVPVIAGIDTRALVRHLRSRGVMRGVLSATCFDRETLVERARSSPSMTGLDLATQVSTPSRYEWALASRSVFAIRSGARSAIAAVSRRRLTISGSSTIFCGGWCRWAAGSPWFRRGPPRKTCWR